ncbi:glycine cleavage system regulatory protein [Pokkaliibacter plantistimulans]|uniref:Glycine cleavage system regulatory protein n=2 Tax=Pseudomonadota TaxID=1224 RepID=A0ABX5LYT5_9GAMM|nr:LysR substrate-binding domain-containing protein [Pokkaliibacter plantistimulans]PXF31471.1 glycine cleavage system regulatory protein [Pokkaliibacter plantistimulans]
MSTLPPLPALRSFEAVARLGSVTLAATELFVTHSAISQQLRLLEDLLGVPLFIREGRGLRLTEDGRMYALQVRQALREISNATQLVRARPREGELVIATLPSFCSQWLLPRFPRFQQRYPDYRVSIRASLDIQDLRQGLVDIGIRMGLGDWEGLEKKRLFEDKIIMVAAPHYNQGKLPRTPKEVMAARLIRSTESWSPWCEVAGGKEPPINRPGGLWINDSNVIMEAVRMGQGVALERLSVVRPFLERGEIVRLTDIVAPYRFPYWLVWPERELSAGKQHDFIEWMMEEAQRYQQELDSYMAAV